MYRYPVTIILIAINAIIFLLLRTGKLRVEKLWSSYILTIKNREYYRVITSAFTQKEYIHFAMNMISLYNIGSVLEPVIGIPLFTAYYAVLVMAGGIISSLLKKKKSPMIPSIGASGAICGLFGIYVVLSLVLLGLGSISSILPTLLILIAMTFSNRIDSTGHFTGLILGIILGLSFLAL